LSDPAQVKGAVEGIPLLKSFFKSERYGQQAREVAVGFIVGITRDRIFESLFGPIKANTTSSNYHDLMEIAAGVDDQYLLIQNDINKAQERWKKAQAAAASQPPSPYRTFPSEPMISRGRNEPPMTVDDANDVLAQVNMELVSPTVPSWITSRITKAKGHRSISLTDTMAISICPD
jgi:hypothetical protein